MPEPVDNQDMVGVLNSHAPDPSFGYRRNRMSFPLFLTYVVCTYLRPFETIAPGLAPLRPLLVLWVFAFVAAVASALSQRKIAARPVHLTLLVLLVVVIALSMVANHWAGGAPGAIADFSPAVMLMVLALLNLTSLSRLRTTCATIAACVVVLAALSAYSYHTGFMSDQLILHQTIGGDDDGSQLSVGEDSSKLLLRAQSFGFLSDPNDFSQTMVMALPLLWMFYVPGQRRLRTFALLVVPAAILAYTTLLTQSRGAMLGLAALALLKLRAVIGLTRTLILMGVGGLGIAGAASFGGRGFSSKEQSAAQRVEAWQAGLTMLRNEPILGVGYGRFTEHHYITAHNSFVLCFAELGLTGYFLWLGLIVLTFKGLSQAIRQAPLGTPDRSTVLLLRAALVAFMACGWFLSRTYSPGLFLLLGLCVAAWSVVRQAHGHPTSANSEPPPLWRKTTFIAMLGSIAAVYVFVLVQRSNE